MSMLTLSLTLEMLSDWSIGSGAGRQGALDSLVARDADGLPYVPGTSLRGIWRDAAEQVAFGLDEGEAGGWTALLGPLFGEQPAIAARDDAGEATPAPERPPLKSRLIVGDARFPPVVRALVKGDTRLSLRRAFCLVKPGVAIDWRSGRAKNEALRFDEVARGGAVLQASASFELSGEDEDAAMLSLALAASKLVERLGGDRRRGSGSCRFTIEPADAVWPRHLPAGVNAAVSRIAEDAWRSPPQPAKTGASKAETTPYTDPGGKDFRRFRIEVELLTPTVVADEVQGNVITTRDHIPGTMLLAPVARLLAGSKIGLDGRAMRAGFANGDIRVLPAYPLIDGERALPTPLVWERKKDNDGGPDGEGELRNRLRADERTRDGEPWKLQRTGFVHAAIEDQRLKVKFARPSTDLKTHNTVEDRRQKPTERVGGVYVYAALPAGTRLAGELWLRENVSRGVPSGRARATIGRARRSGYGSVELSIGNEIGEPAHAVGGEEVTLYLASDMVLPASPVVLGTGEASSAPGGILEHHLRKVLGTEVKLDEGDLRTRRSEGWIAAWQLPRQSLVSIAAGSTIRIQAQDGRFSDEALGRLMREGLGLRRGEGFGHVLIDHPLVTAQIDNAFIKSPERKDGGPSEGDRKALADLVKTDGALRKFLTRIEDAAIAAAIEQDAEQTGATSEARKTKLGWGRQKPNMSQLGALRAVIGRLDDASDLARAASFLDAIARSDRASRWGSGPPDPLKQLHDMFSHPEDIWATIGLVDDQWRPLLLVSTLAEAKGNAARQRQGIAAFLHGAMRAHKRAQESLSNAQSAEA